MTDGYAGLWPGSWFDGDALSVADSEVLHACGFASGLQLTPKRGAPYLSEFGDTRALHFDHRTIQSEMSISNPLDLALDYTRVMMGFLLFNPRPATIDMIGLGGGSLAKYCYYKVPSSVVTAVEIDRDVIALRGRFLIPEDCGRFRILWGDGADYVRQSRRQADVLLVDGFDMDGQPPELCSQDFYDDCYRHLAPGGIFVVNLWEKHRLCKSRIRRSFGDEVVVVQTECGDNRAVFARKGGSLAQFTDDATGLMHGERHARFLPQVARRIRHQMLRRDLIGQAAEAIRSSAADTGTASR
ncbi:hypothetical protein [Sphingomonas sp. UNC305MFCol5.2]|uniref:spermine/spermidine synthase domain-containing protein n=1 Tax=Sphingomonas sp. UNC305MFCol5.2 TaxID=1449076 RepID=UPI0009DD8B57|nr:hypothetical protein [Sphingomonas sp. UNC305MFCol5.2]